MTDEQLHHILYSFRFQKPEITFLRHNENRTYKVSDADGSTYVLRVHQPFKESMTGLQHTYEGLLGELLMLESLAKESSLLVQSPLRNRDGELITVIEHEGQRLNCSVLTWLEGRDLQKEDVQKPELVKLLGSQVAELHEFYRQYPQFRVKNRPEQGIAYNVGLIRTIHTGLDLGLFASSDVAIIEKCIHLINDKLEQIGTDTDRWGLIHGDLGFGNMIISPEGQLSFIDFGFFGPGYDWTDIAMGAMMVPSAHRNIFLEGYYGTANLDADELVLIEGMMLISIIGYYAFQMGNESVHNWMREKMPKFCADHCVPFLAGKRIFYQV